MMGVSKFFFYAHMCVDNTLEVLRHLKNKLDIEVVVIPDRMDRVQLSAWQHSCDHHLSKVDWMVFMDGDEFMFSPAHPNLLLALKEFDDEPLSAVAAYNVSFGSSGHIKEPTGNIIENFRLCTYDALKFPPNRNVKSFVKGRQKVRTTLCSNVFHTPLGTYDELMRPIAWGLSEYQPSYQKIRFNHYACQSYEYYTNLKRNSGHADAGSLIIRDDDWFRSFDRRDEFDSSLAKYYNELNSTIGWLKTP